MRENKDLELFSDSAEAESILAKIRRTRRTPVSRGPSFILVPALAHSAKSRARPRRQITIETPAEIPSAGTVAAPDKAVY